jgi:hypothetical protein
MSNNRKNIEDAFTPASPVRSTRELKLSLANTCPLGRPMEARRRGSGTRKHVGQIRRGHESSASS